MIKRLLIAVAMLCASVAAFGQAAPVAIPHMQFFDQNGLPCSGCNLFTYVAGTTTPQPTYTDAAGVSQNTNPIILDASGFANIWTGSTPYKFVLKNASGTVIWTADNVKSTSGSGAACGSANKIQTSNGSGILSCTAATADAAGNIVAPGAITSQSVNNVVQVCGYPGGTLDAQIIAAEAAYSGVQATFEINTRCSNPTIATQFWSQANHNFRVTQPMTITMTAAWFFGANSSLTGTGNGTIFQMLPSSSSTGLWVDNRNFNTSTDITVNNDTFRDYTIDQNSVAWISAGANSTNDRGIVIATDGATPAPNNISISGVNVINVMNSGIQMIGASGNHVNNITIDKSTFTNAYNFQVDVIGLSDNVSISNSKFQGYGQKYALPISTVTASGTTATITMSTPLNNVLSNSNQGTLIITGCSDSHYNFPYTVNTAPSITAFSTTAISYTIPAGAAASTTGCTATWQNRTPPIRGDSSVANGVNNLAITGNTITNTACQREFAIELFAASTANFNGLKIANEIHDASGCDAGSGISVNAQYATFGNNQLKNGTGGSITNGCECTLFQSSMSGDSYQGGVVSVTGPGSNTISGLSLAGPTNSLGLLQIDTSNSTFSNISVNIGSGGGAGGVDVGRKGGAIFSSNNVLNNINVVATANGGAPNACVVILGTSGSGQLTINGGSCSGMETGIFGDGAAVFSGLTLNGLDLSGVTGNAFQLGTVNDVIESNIKLTGTQAAALDGNNRIVYGNLAVSPITTFGTMSIGTRGTNGSTSYTYACVGSSGSVIAPAVSASTTFGNATLSTTNLNVVNCPLFLGATTTTVYRTAGGATQGKIGTFQNNGTYLFDTGLAGDATSPPAANNYGSISVGSNSIPQVGTPTAGQAACVKSVTPVVIGFCSNTVGAGGACTCN